MESQTGMVSHSRLTGGFVPQSDDVFERAIRSQVDIAVEEADEIVFVVDCTTGITDLDEEFANKLRRVEKKVFLAVNKVDNEKRMLDANEFWSLGFENTFFISAITGSGTGELLDAITEVMVIEEPEDLGIPKFAVVGQPNVGKSSFVNALLGEERNIVTNIAGTTRDAIHTRYRKFGQDFLIIDTAGIRKKKKVHEDLEFYSVMRAVRSLEDCDVIILIVDATLGFESQDMNIFRLAQKRNKGIVMLVNKWDLIEKDTNTMKTYKANLLERISPFTDIPIVFTSALEKQRIFQAIEQAVKVFENRTQKIPTSKLNNWLQETLAKNAPPSHKGRFPNIKYVTQLPTYYPAFAFFCGNPKYVKADYKQYLENRIREAFELSGCPIGMFFRNK